MWDEGQLDSLHVLSRDTAVGDELGHEFGSSVINSGCTFSSFCQLKNELYKILMLNLWIKLFVLDGGLVGQQV